MKEVTNIQSEQGRVARRRARVRADLLAAACQVFISRGYQDATITEIVRAADVTMGTFYLHFRDEEDLLLVLAEEGLTLLREHVHEAIEAQRDQPRIPLIIRVLLRTAYQQRDLFLLLCLEESRQRVHIHGHRAQEGLVGHFIPVLQQAREDGEFSGDPVLQAHLLVGMLLHAITWWGQQDEPDPEVMADQILSLLEHGWPSSLFDRKRTSSLRAVDARAGTSPRREKKI
jgi:AcrR family transcriptional regulator